MNIYIYHLALKIFHCDTQSHRSILVSMNPSQPIPASPLAPHFRMSGLGLLQRAANMIAAPLRCSASLIDFLAPARLASRVAKKSKSASTSVPSLLKANTCSHRSARNRFFSAECFSSSFARLKLNLDILSFNFKDISFGEWNVY